MGRLFQARAKVDINSKIKKGFMITAEAKYTSPQGSDIERAIENQFGKEAARYTGVASKWEFLN